MQSKSRSGRKRPHKKKPAHLRKNSPWFGRQNDHSLHLLRNLAKGMGMRMRVIPDSRDEYDGAFVEVEGTAVQIAVQQGIVRCELRAIFDHGSLWNINLQCLVLQTVVSTDSLCDHDKGSRTLTQFREWTRAQIAQHSAKAETAARVAA